MTALDAVAIEGSKTVHSALGRVITVADNGSVITRDHAVGILIKMCSVKAYENEAFKLLLDQLRRCPTNQLPMYAENARIIVNEKNKEAFVKTLRSRLGKVEKASKRKRLENVITQLGG